MASRTISLFAFFVRSAAFCKRRIVWSSSVKVTFLTIPRQYYHTTTETASQRLENMRRLLLASVSCVFLLKATVTPEEARQWREDLHFAASEMEKIHKNLFHSVTREAFSAMVACLNDRIPSLSRHQILVEMAKIAAAVGDGHTNLAPTRDPKIAFRTLPIALYFFEDGLFIRAAHNSQSSLIGARVVRIGKAGVADAYATVKTMISRDNEQGVLYWAPQFLVMPEVLHALGLIDDLESVPLTI